MFFLSVIYISVHGQLFCNMDSLQWVTETLHWWAIKDVHQSKYCVLINLFKVSGEDLHVLCFVFDNFEHSLRHT